MLSNIAYMMRGPSLSTSMPTTIRAGMVNDTFKINNALTSCSLSPKTSRMVASNGAWLNHTKKLMKKATQVRCKTFVLP